VFIQVTPLSGKCRDKSSFKTLLLRSTKKNIAAYETNHPNSKVIQDKAGCDSAVLPKPSHLHEDRSDPWLEILKKGYNEDWETIFDDLLKGMPEYLIYIDTEPIFAPEMYKSEADRNVMLEGFMDGLYEVCMLPREDNSIDKIYEPPNLPECVQNLMRLMYHYIDVKLTECFTGSSLVQSGESYEKIGSMVQVRRTDSFGRHYTQVLHSTKVKLTKDNSEPKKFEYIYDVHVDIESGKYETGSYQINIHKSLDRIKYIEDALHLLCKRSKEDEENDDMLVYFCKPKY